MKNILIDAGPLIALFNNRDQYHTKALEFLKKNNNILWTTWPVVTETTHMLDFSVQTQVNFMHWIYRGGLQIFDLEIIDIKRIMELCQKFSDVPMDFADASLTVASERKRIKEIASIDSDFYISRDIRKQYLKNVFL